MVVTDAIRIVVADDHAIFREGFETMLKKQDRIRIVGLAADGEELIHKVEKLHPVLIITDIKMPRMDGIQAIKLLREKYPQLGIIALTMFDEESLVIEALEAGANGFLLKNTNKVEVIQAIQAVYNKENYFCRGASRKLVRLLSSESFNPFTPGKKPQFSEREIQIMRLICQQLSNKEIATRLRINRRAVESTRERIQEKIKAKNMVGIALYAIKNGIYFIE